MARTGARADSAQTTPLSLIDLDANDGEPRVKDVRIGYDSPRRLSALIRRYNTELLRYGSILRTVRENTDNEVIVNAKPLTRLGCGGTVIAGAPNGVETGGERSSDTSGGRPESQAAIFMPGFCPAHAPMAGRLRIQNPSGEEAGPVWCQVSNAPAASGAVESLFGGVAQHQQEG